MDESNVTQPLKKEPVYELTERGYTLRGWYGGGDGAPGRIEVTRDGKIVREVYCPSYRIWNYAAHFGEIVDDLESALGDQNLNIFQ